MTVAVLQYKVYSCQNKGLFDFSNTLGYQKQQTFDFTNKKAYCSLKRQIECLKLFGTLKYLEKSKFIKMNAFTMQNCPKISQVISQTLRIPKE